MRQLFLCFIMVFSSINSFNKVIIWGHKLHTHTHSYIHNAFYRAFQHMGYETYWFDNYDNVRNVDFSDSLFITEGLADRNIPVRSDCKYIIHNCKLEKYKELLAHGRAVILQVYTDAVLERPITKVDDCIYYDFADKCIYMPWATDLLPHEIDFIKKKIPTVKRNTTAWWIGTIWDGEFGNEAQIEPFKTACQENNIKFKQGHGKSMKDNINKIVHSYLAPAIVGEWQQKVGYIPCRIFKNISYGHIGVTNSKRVYELFQKKIVYNPDTYQLFYDAQERMASLTRKELFELMDFVKDKHTYINRIETLLSFLKLVEENTVETLS